MSSGLPWEAPPTFKVDLGLPPEHRWEHVVREYLPQLQNLHRYVVDTAEQEYGVALSLMVGKVASLCSWAMMDRNLRLELEGIASQTAVFGLTYDKLLQLNIGYDLLARCTSAAVACPGSGPVHLRNMDWDAEAFWPLTINVEFHREGRLIAMGTTWVGFVGLQTGLRPGGWSVSLNYRQVQGQMAIVKNLVSGLTSAWPVSFLLRLTLENTADFASALRVLRCERLMAPCYLTLVGTEPGQGVVLERSRRGVDRCQALDPRWAAGDPRVALMNDACVATNIDCCIQAFDFALDSADRHWAEHDPLLLTALERRKTALGLIDRWVRAAAAGCGLELEGGFVVLGTMPVCNDQTVYSCVIRPSDGAYESRVVLRWEEHTRSVDAAAFEAFLASPAFDATRRMQLVGVSRSLAATDGEGRRWSLASDDLPAEDVQLG